MMESSRTHRLLGGLSIGYVALLLNMVVGLVLTPFLIGSLGSHTYGLWLVALQLLGYMALLDIGVLALVPRETAATSGGGVPARVAAVTGELRVLTRWQAPVMALVGVSVLAWLPTGWHDLRLPLAVTLAAFVLLFPLRTYAGMLQGLQDHAFCGRWQLYAWSAGTLVLAAAAYGGAGLMAPVLGWIVHQSLFAGVCRWRVRQKFPALAGTAPAVSLALARRYLGRGMWVSISQVSQILTTGTDLLLVARLLNPTAAVIYSCTAKLTSVLVNPPQMILHLAQPALSEVGARADSNRFLAVFGAVVQAVLIISGALAVLVWAANEAFVTWWVGADQFGSVHLTAALVSALVLRHAAVSLNYAAFCLGAERRLSLTVVSEGIGAVAGGALLLGWMGLPGAPAAAAAAAALVNIPQNARTVARCLAVPVAGVLAPYLAWARQAALAAGALGLAWLVVPLWHEHVLLRVLVGLVAYAAAMAPLGFRAPLAAYRPALLAYVSIRTRRPAEAPSAELAAGGRH
jgi:O-antigen/teichoic acid export membrane protein